MLSKCELILEIVDANEEQNSAIPLILDNWYELGSFLFSHLLRYHFDIYFDMLESLSLTWNRFRCYMSLLASNVLSVEDVLPGMMTRLLMIENKEDAVRIERLCDLLGQNDSDVFAVYSPVVGSKSIGHFKTVDGLL